MAMAMTFGEFAPAAPESLERMPVLAAIWQVWQQAHAATNGRPGRAAIDPLALPAAAWRHCFLFDAKDGDYRVRLFGTFMVELAGRDCTGRWLSQTGTRFAESGDRHVLGAVTAEGRPYLWRHLRATPGEPETTLLATLLTPLFDADGAVAMIFGATVLPSQPPDVDPAMLGTATREFVRSLFRHGRVEGEPQDGRYRIVL